jgi:hypothetical protein
MANGFGCKCSARSSGECACSDVDWTPSELIDARERIRLLEHIILGFKNCAIVRLTHEEWREVDRIVMKAQ